MELFGEQLHSSIIGVSMGKEGAGVEEITGYVEHIIFRNDDNGYTVMNFAHDGEEVTCIGTFSAVNEGMCLRLKGEYVEHPTYGRQWKVSSFEEEAPRDLISMERYLGSGAVKGVGPALAAKIVRHFQEDTFRIMEEEPERLSEIKGISERKAMEISEQVEEKKELRQAMIFLQGYGISLNLAVKIYRKYEGKIFTILKENPYQLAEDIQGVGFKTADEIAARVGIRADSDFRIRSGILYVLSQAAQEGHTYLPREELDARASRLLGIEPAYLEKHYMDLAMERKIILKEKGTTVQVFSAAYYKMEAHVAAMLGELDLPYDVPLEEVESRIRVIERQVGMELDELQKKALTEAIFRGVFVLTGGPGTGKTTTINAIIQYFEMENLDICLAAPTGRAAKRLSEMTGHEAKTIHRLLEPANALEENARFEKNEDNPLETDVVIIDEMSMVDISLMHALLKALVPGVRLILAGDANQLPSVGPGSVLRDLIDSGMYQVVKLTKIFRQASKSDIVVNAHKINRGEEIALDNKSKDFFFLKRYEADAILKVVIQLVQEKLPRYVDARPFDIQVLTPMRKGLLGVERLNQILQRYLNPKEPGKAEKEVGERIFRVGDKVMQTKNNYQLEWEVRGMHGIVVEKGQGIFNGDLGIIREVNAFAQTLSVEFDEGRIVDYSFKNLEELELAYAITIHKSQGSEYPAVVIPLLGGPKMLMNRNLLYTAVTRARKCVALVGDEQVFFQMQQNVTEQVRYSGLADRICEA